MIEAIFVVLAILLGATGIILVGIFWPDIEELQNSTGHKRVKRSIRRQAKRDVLPTRRTPYQRRKDLVQRVREIQQREVMTIR